MVILSIGVNNATDQSCNKWWKMHICKYKQIGLLDLKMQSMATTPKPQNYIFVNTILMASSWRAIRIRWIRHCAGLKYWLAVQYVSVRIVSMPCVLFVKLRRKLSYALKRYKNVSGQQTWKKYRQNIILDKYSLEITKIPRSVTKRSVSKHAQPM